MHGQSLLRFSEVPRGLESVLRELPFRFLAHADLIHPTPINDKLGDAAICPMLLASRPVALEDVYIPSVALLHASRFTVHGSQSMVQVYGSWSLVQ